MDRPTMNDVAREAGVSLKTVSRVVNGETTVTPDLAARVRAAVRALDYRPHLGASLLRRADSRTRTIGLLLDDLAEPFAAAVHRAVARAAHARDLHVLAGNLDGDPALADTLAAGLADGLIIAPDRAGQDHADKGRLAGLPVVFLNRGGNGLPADTVVSAEMAGVTAAVRHLVAHGHRRIAYLGGRTRDRHRGYLRALGGRAGPVVIDLRDAAAAERVTLGLLRRTDPPTAVLSGHSAITLGVVRGLHRLGLQRSVALAGFGDFPSADLLEPGVTVIAQDPARTGRAAAEALFERLDGYDGPPREIRIPTTLVPRGSGEITRTPG